MISTESRTYSRQRNRYVILASVLVLASLLFSLPRTIRYRDELKAANGELVKLQSAIVELQGRIRSVQSDIKKSRDDIEKALLENQKK